MGKSSPSPPPAPDPKETAAAQGVANEATARVTAKMNRVDQVTPYGNLTYEDLGDDRWRATQTLSPDEQAQLAQSNQAIATYGRAANAQLLQAEQTLSQRFNPEIVDRSGDIQRTLDFGQFGNPSATRDSVEAALNARLQPQQDRDRAALETRLANQGITMGSEAWRSGMDDYSRALTDQRLAVTAQGRGEQESLYNMALGAANLNNSAVGQQSNLDTSRLAQLLAVRNQPINEASALLSGGQINMPQFTNVPQVGVGQTDYLGAVGQQQAGQNAAYQGQVSTQNANTAGMAGVGAAAVTAAAVIA